jgi:hypothetical protein
VQQGISKCVLANFLERVSPRRIQMNHKSSMIVRKYLDNVTLKKEPEFWGDVGVNTPTSPQNSDILIRM